MQTLRKKTSPLKYRNEPARFFGDGVMFKAKLIGILEVGEARGDRMCQEALQDLKMAIRAAGEHKQRITIHVTIDGLRLRDEKSGESLYHHPVHKISFIAQDMTDSRAFGYIFGSPDCGHRFFGIKTDKAASQVVLAMRDLFQVVFELKKKEIELAKQHIQNRITAHEHQQVAMSVKNSILELNKSPEASKSMSKNDKSPESVADLVDLEQELSSIQRGITQMERITPNDDPPSLPRNVLDDDPFGDSFASFPSAPFSILPPPSSAKRNFQQKQSDTENGTKSSTPPIPPFPSTSLQNSGNSHHHTESWLNSPPMTSSGFDDSEVTRFADDIINPSANKSFDDSNNLNLIINKSQLTDAFTDLDPLGTGKSKPYIDKKYFFQDLKNPPKKQLKDLSEHDSVFDTNFSPTNKRSYNNDQSLSMGLENSLTSSVKSDMFVVQHQRSIDPFEEEDFSKLSIDPFEMSKSISPKSIILPDTKIFSTSDDGNNKIKLEERKSNDSGSGSASSSVFNGPLQVNLPPEAWSTSFTAEPKRIDRQSSDSGQSKGKANVFTVDVFAKKLPKSNLFGRNVTKRDSNGINMRRLQESDSLSENETAPEPPPRPDMSSFIEPPPLPPKGHRDILSDFTESKNNNYKQFSDVGSRTGRTTKDSNTRYEYTSRFKTAPQSENSPPLPLPSRKVTRVESSFPGPGRPYKKPSEDDDYLAPIAGQSNDIPTLLPPPQKKDPSKLRGTRKSETDPKNLDAPTPPVSAKPQDLNSTASILPDITLSQLLTLGIDDLANKLNVPAVKLDKMTLGELNIYLSDFVEKSKHTNIYDSSESPPNESPVFKVNFDDSNDATFVAKFDDNFGDEENSFVANFDNFNQQPVSQAPTADRYAVFREIMELDKQPIAQESVESNNSTSLEEAAESSLEFQKEVDMEMNRFSPRPGSLENRYKSSPSTILSTKIDTKITDAISGAKDRYAALRDILVEDLFDKSALPPLASISDSNLSDDFVDDQDQVFDNIEECDLAENNSTENLPTYSISWADAVTHEQIESQPEEEKSSNILSTSNKDDFEIDAYMKKAISELSLDNRDRFSPKDQSKSPNITTTKVGETHMKQQTSSPQQLKKPSPMLNDMSTSPIGTPSKSPMPMESQRKSPSIHSNKSPVPMSLSNESRNKEGSRDRSLTPLNDHSKSREKTITPKDLKPLESESWAVFEPVEQTKLKKETTPTNVKPLAVLTAEGLESPYSSDGKNEWKQNKEYNRRWQKPHTSSSSRDVSPWDEDGPPPSDYRRRPPPQPQPPNPQYHSERYARPPPPPGNRHNRRINSCDEDYEDDMTRRPRNNNRMTKGPTHRSKEILDSENPNWYHNPEQWSPAEEEDEERRRSFDRNAYERSTYGPPYEKREPKSFPYEGRRDFKNYDKRSKYYRRNEYDYEYDQYDAPPPPPMGVNRKSRKEFEDYESGTFERGTRESRSAREYFYHGDRKSFDSNESYDSGPRANRSLGSGEIPGNYGEYRDRERYVSRSLRRGVRSRAEDEQQHSEEEGGPPRRPSGETGSLQRPSGSSRGKPIPIHLDDEVWGNNKPWKRPSSATATEAERRYPTAGNQLTGSDGEKDKRAYRKKGRGKGKEMELRSNYATIRYSQQRKEYDDFEDEPNYDDTESTSPPQRPHPDSESAMYYTRRKGGLGTRTSTTPRSETKNFGEYIKTAPRYASGGFEDNEEEEYENRKQHSRGGGGGNSSMKKSTSKDLYIDESREPRERYVSTKFIEIEEQRPGLKPAIARNNRTENDYEDQQPPIPHQASSSAASSGNNNKFNFDDSNGFESDFNNSPPKPQQLEPAPTPKVFRFSNDFSDKEDSPRRPVQQQHQPKMEPTFEADFSSPSNNPPKSGNSNGSNTQQKLRFNENVSVSKFEDDFLEQWTPESASSGNIQSSMKKLNSSNLKSSSVFRHENIKKSESVNIFARKADDPFENDDFFNEEGGNNNNNNNNNNGHKGGMQDPFHWSNKNNFANFDDNNI